MKLNLLTLFLFLPCIVNAELIGVPPVGPSGLPDAAPSPVPAIGDGLNKPAGPRPTAAMKLSEVELAVLAEHYKKLFGKLQELIDSDVMYPDDAGSNKKRIEMLRVRLQQLKVEIEERDEKIQRSGKELGESRPAKTG